MLTPTRVAPGPASAAFSAASPCTPPQHPILRGSALRGINEGSSNSPVRPFPSPAAARMERAAASAFPRASHPADQEPDNARRGGDRPPSTDLELHAQLTSVDLRSGSSLVVCDLASHATMQKRLRPRLGASDAREVACFTSRLRWVSAESRGLKWPALTPGEVLKPWSRRSGKREVLVATAAAYRIGVNVPLGGHH